MNSYELQKARAALQQAGLESDAIPLVQTEDGSYAVDPSAHAVIPYAALPSDDGAAPAMYQWQTGDKFPGGFGDTKLYIEDYWTLRHRSGQLFKDNLYARGLIRRLITSEINTGLALEATPEEKLLGYGEDELAEWSEDVETRWELYNKTPGLCDYFGQLTGGALQRAARMEALISGDVLCVMRINRRTNLPALQLISGSLVQSPLSTTAAGRDIRHGVEVDRRGRHVAFWVVQEDGSYERIPAIGPRTGRRVAWLLYGTEKRLDAVRGEPLLALCLQALRELDRYRDAALRKAVLNSFIATYIKKGTDKPSTLPFQGAALRKGVGEAASPDPKNPRRFKAAEFMPGMMIEELQEGEEPVPGQSGAEIQLGPFEDIITQAIAWANEVPPEILRLAFSSNYSASQAANNEFKLYQNRVRDGFGHELLQPWYQEWLLPSVLTGRVRAPGLLEARRDPGQYDTLAAWFSASWCGAIKSSVDIVKTAKGYQGLIEMGACTRDRASRETTGTKYSRNVRKLKLENQKLLEAMQPLREAQQIAGEAGGNAAALTSLADGIAELLDRTQENS